MDEGGFVAGKKAGEWKVYDEDGKLTKTTKHKA
jgi:antitoxin component YwqK of YwqJK toxin-antitoxin module